MNPKNIAIRDLDYDLPFEKIATKPLSKRDESKLLVYKNGKLTDDIFINAHHHLPKKTFIVFNNTKVVHARILFKTETGAFIELFCLEPYASKSEITSAMLKNESVEWLCLVGNLKKWKTTHLTLTQNGITISAEKISKIDNHVAVKLSWEPKELSFAEILNKTGILPIPPYFKRETEKIDLERYQTLYASIEGSVAAPTAGLHFTNSVFDKLKSIDANINYVTLHVGAGTFMPVKSNTLENHVMHSEWMEVDVSLIKKLQSESFIVAVGTTSLRTLETLYWMGIKCTFYNPKSINDLEVMQWDPYELEGALSYQDSLNNLVSWMHSHNLSRLVCRTSLLIAPPYQLKIVKAIFTNFHQPQSTLLALVSAIVGENWKKIYNHALNNSYRFLSYGDSSLLFKSE
ncbi:MAG: S-adenosylmethionine:tRNA ribosyltransferase-isomerase [Bacteroidetes bacterium]|nr:S-adenosylmethionine:tRNA ribosyltransferase-isomerase [Bacteroidota bacterium]MCA6442352.1 S-adenosylmethionine:tRNA ribosyltransferase-isomerase [Bacteroidota bacterium]